MSLGKKLLDTLTPFKQGTLLTQEKSEASLQRKRIIVQDGMSPKLSLIGHGVLSFLFVTLVLVYAIIAFVSHFNRPEVESFMQAPAVEHDAVKIRIRPFCSNPPHCGSINITVNYTTAVSSRCAGEGLNFYGTEASQVASSSASVSTPVEILLCYVSDSLFVTNVKTQLPLPGVSITFSGINPGIDIGPVPWVKNTSFLATGVVDLEVISNHQEMAGGGFHRLQTMDAWQVKTLVIGQTISKVEETVSGHQVFPVAVQYEGKHRNWRGTLRITLEAFVNIYQKQRPGRLLTVLTSVGGAAYIVAAALGILALLLKICLPGAKSKDKEDHSTPIEGDGDDKSNTAEQEKDMKKGE